MRKWRGRSGRPLPSGQVTLAPRVIFMLVLCLIGLAVLLSFNSFTIWLGLGVLPIVALYPFVKRFSHWPQVVLGLAFNWGALLGLAGGARAPRLAGRSSSMPAPSPGPSATTRSTPIRTARTTT